MTNSRPLCFAVTAAKTAFKVFEVLGSSPEKYVAGESNRFDVVDPRTYMTNAFACA